MPVLEPVIHLDPGALARQMADDVREGLTATPKTLPPKYFYDAHGSRLFDEITRLPEYYPTRCERGILEARAGEVARLSGADTLIELGSGTSEKTHLLLDALAAGGRLRRIVAFDVSEATLRHAAGTLAREYPEASVHAVVGDFEHHLSALPGGGRRLVAFLGGTIGNLAPEQRASFLSELTAVLEPGDSLLLGTDLVKDADRLEAAYDDAGGVTADFNRNVLRVVNRELGADFVPEQFDHVARFDADEEWIEMWLRSDDAQQVQVPALGITVAYEAGEAMRTEISAKFRRSGVESELGNADLSVARWWTDPDGDFAVSLSFRD